MGGSRRRAEPVKTIEQSQERKKGFGDWMNLIKPANEEKDHWVKIRCILFWFPCPCIPSCFENRILRF